MNYSQEKKDQKEFLNKITKKCWEDINFKEELIANPIETMEIFFGKPLNKKDGKTIYINDQTDPSFFHINIPVKPNFDDVELSDAELEAVAGGADYEILWSLICSNN